MNDRRKKLASAAAGAVFGLFALNRFIAMYPMTEEKPDDSKCYYNYSPKKQVECPTNLKDLMKIPVCINEAKLFDAETNSIHPTYVACFKIDSATTCYQHNAIEKGVEITFGMVTTATIVYSNGKYTGKFALTLNQDYESEGIYHRFFNIRLVDPCTPAILEPIRIIRRDPSCTVYTSELFPLGCFGCACSSDGIF